MTQEWNGRPWNAPKEDKDALSYIYHYRKNLVVAAANAGKSMEMRVHGFWGVEDVIPNWGEMPGKNFSSFNMARHAKFKSYIWVF